ncbi:MAG: YlmH/Sll1252 family protein [Thomasclavelia sp.]|nr:YlmH/Sll1252 family protein [Thomasclavelia sp.]
MLEHFKGDEVFVRKVLDYKFQVEDKQRIVLTKFLNPNYQDIIKSIIGNNDDIQVLTDGGIEGSETKRVILAPKFYEITKEDFEITVIKITYPSAFEKLNHRDVLGALMSLGVDRELFGDIVKDKDDFFVAIESNMYNYLIDNLKQIKRSKIKISKAENIVEVKYEYSRKTFIVSSLRLDKILSSFYKIPRSKAASFINSGYVRVNHKDIEEINYLCNNNDIISFKKHGRVKFVNTNRKTKSDNFVVEGYFYK